MRARRLLLVPVVALLGSLLAAPPAPAAIGRGSANMSHVANLRYPLTGSSIQYGSDVEFTRLTHLGTERDFAVAGSLGNGLHLIDISNPAAPVRVKTYDCRVAQGDTQVFSRGGRTYTTFAADYNANVSSKCFQEVNTGGARTGTFIVDITNPAAPVAVSFWPFSGGSHNMTVHPGGEYMYNSANDTDGVGRMEIVDIRNLSAPVTANIVSVLTGVDPHDITFNADGSRAYAASLSHSVIFDTTDPSSPVRIGSIVDPTISIHHQSDPVTIVDPILGARDFLVVTDEVGGGSLSHTCPGGGLHVFDITGDLERTPVKVGYFAPGDYGGTATFAGGVSGSASGCTSHVLRMHPDEKIMTIAWYGAGVRVLDISGLVGASVSVQRIGYGYSGQGIDVSQKVGVGSTGAGIKELGWYQFPDSDTWSAKTNRIAPDGSFYLFANDIKRGFDVYRYTPPAQAAAAQSTGTWLAPGQEPVKAEAGAPSYTTYCSLLGQTVAASLS